MNPVNWGRTDTGSRQTLRKSRLGSIGSALALAYVCALVVLSAARAEESHPGLAAESTYAEAVIAFNKKDYARSQQVLRELFKANPKHIEGLQLLALIAKAQSKPDIAYDAYRRLLALSAEKDRGPYYFELGTLLHARKQFAFAKPLFRRAIARRFNVVPSHLFLGLMEFADSKLSEAEDSFRVVARERDPDMSAVGHYYLGIIQLKNGFGGLGLGDLLEAKAAADRAPPESKSTHELGEAAAKVIAPFDKGQWFASATLIPQYDSNVGLTPISGFGASGLYAFKVNYSAGGGYLTSPMRLFQLVASLRATGNFNFLNATETYNFHNLTPSLYLTYKPMGHVSLGAKAEGTFTAQYSTTDGTNYANRPFAMIGDPGLYLRWQPSGRFQLQWDAGFRPQYYFSASDFSGLATYTRISMRVTTPIALINPGFALNGEFNHATGELWRYVAPSTEISNLFRIGSKDTLILSGTVTGYRYAWWSRLDGNITTRLSNVFNINTHISVLADLSYIVNTSSESQYSYNRWTVGVGGGWTL